MVHPSDTDHPPSVSGTAERRVYSVSQLNREVKHLLLQNLPQVWLEGELSNVARPASGHLYFSLKDEHAQVRGVMFSRANRSLPFEPGDGMHVLVRASVTLYEPRGQYQLIVEHMEEAGVGILQRRYEELKGRLSEEGLFRAAHKQALPGFPATLCIVTSATGAAIRDILSVLARRFPPLFVRVYAIPVQGEASAPAVVDAIQTINRRKDGDVIILARGGGSIEDLWSFNEESVARAIFASKLPVVTGIGHEVDFTIADFVADLRAPTPSAAAELVVPDAAEILETLEQLRESMTYLVHTAAGNLHQTLDWMRQRLEHLHPKLTVQRNRQLLVELARRAENAAKLKHSYQDNALISLHARLGRLSPELQIHKSRIQLTHLHTRLNHLVRVKKEHEEHQLEALARTLDTASPNATLKRGYSIVTREKNGQILRDASKASPDERIQVQLAKGRLSARVE
ncbi:MAG: exodeoxyribonuclease VII large subunit [Proteobacteria bacterium]|nr:exodeoxyribonuclease VII large subunit [Pseudomonadota bacterium]